MKTTGEREVITISLPRAVYLAVFVRWSSGLDAGSSENWGNWRTTIERLLMENNTIMEMMEIEALSRKNETLRKIIEKSQGAGDAFKDAFRSDKNNVKKANLERRAKEVPRKILRKGNKPTEVSPPIIDLAEREEISISLPINVVKAIDMLSKLTNMSRSEVIEAVLEKDETIAKLTMKMRGIRLYLHSSHS